MTADEIRTSSNEVASNELERVVGIEPTYQAWEARVLPLYYTRKASSHSSKPCRQIKRDHQLLQADQRAGWRILFALLDFSITDFVRNANDFDHADFAALFPAEALAG